ncbi:helix-turn-helix domain-containing protein [Paenibacillus sp. CAU 1782]
MATMGERIKTLREREGLTQRELSEALGYKTTRSLQRLEADEATLTNDQIIVLCLFFDVSADYFLGLSDDGSKRNYNILRDFPSRIVNIESMR